MRKGAIKEKGYILTEQKYCVVLGAINMDIRGVADIHYPHKFSCPGNIYCSAGGVGRNIAHILKQLTPQLLDASRYLICYSGVVLADCNLTPDALEWVFTVADDIPVFIDTVSKFKASNVKIWLPRIHTLKSTQKEMEILWGSPINNNTDQLNAVNALHQQGVQHIFVWMGDASVFCCQINGEQFLLTAPVYTVVDSFGADDGFMAGLLYSFMEGSNFQESAHFAMACATLSRASASINNPTLSVNNAQYLLKNPV